MELGDGAAGVSPLIHVMAIALFHYQDLQLGSAFLGGQPTQAKQIVTKQTCLRSCSKSDHRKLNRFKGVC